MAAIDDARAAVDVVWDNGATLAAQATAAVDLLDLLRLRLNKGLDAIPDGPKFDLMDEVHGFVSAAEEVARKWRDSDP